MIEPQNGATYADQHRFAVHAERLGFDGFVRSDHFLAMTGDGGAGPTDAWATLAALAVQTSRIRLGVLVSSATFRLPGPLAITAAQVDQMSGGRLDVGIGTGWFEAEHRAYGIPFPPLRERFDRLEEQLAIVTGLWCTPPGERFDFRGRYYTLVDCPALPKPAQPGGPPLVVGGMGPRRTPALAARYAAEFNAPFASVEATAEAFARVRDACTRLGRTTPPRLSASQTIVCGRTPDEITRRRQAITATPHLFGTPDAVVAQLAELQRIGTQRVYLQFLDLTDLGHLDVVAEDVIPRLR